MRRAEPAATRDILHKRVLRLLRMDRGIDDPSEVRQQILPFIQSLGSAVLIGGAIRDVARAGRDAFSSDLDFVVYGCDRGEFVAAMEAKQGIRNRFGGYALDCFSLKIDVWHLEDTWAHTAGHVSVSGPADLLNCTFFDWDSVLFDINGMKLVLSHDYLDRLRSKIMDIRLENNPNTIGSLVRALRRAAMWNVYFGPRLTDFCKRNLTRFQWSEVVDLDQRAFAKPLLTPLDRERLLRNLDSPYVIESTVVTLPVPARSQLRLPIGMPMASPTQSLHET